MATVQLRAELFREISPMLDSEVMLRKTIDFIRSLYAAEQTQANPQGAARESAHGYEARQEAAQGALTALNNIKTM